MAQEIDTSAGMVGTIEREALERLAGARDEAALEAPLPPMIPYRA